MLIRIASTYVVCCFSLVLSLPRSRFLDATQRGCVTFKKRLREGSRFVSLFFFKLFLNISLPLFCTTRTWNFQEPPSYTFYGGNVVWVPVHCFSLPLIFTLVAASICHFLTSAIKFSCFFLQRNWSPLFLISRSSLTCVAGGIASVRD